MIRRPPGEAERCVSGTMNKYLRKMILASFLFGIVLSILLLIFRGKYRNAMILFFVSWGILYVAGAFGIPFYVKKLILRYLDLKNGKAMKSDITSYCSSKNKYFLKENVEVWLKELEAKNKITIEDGLILKRS